MVAHSSDMQAPSPHTIPRHLRTAYHPHLLTNTPLFLAALHRTHHYHTHEIPTDSFAHTSTSSALLPPFTMTHHSGSGIVPRYGCRWTRYQDTETSPSRRWALECHNNSSFHYPRTLTASFWLYWTTAVSAELNTDDPDPTLTPCLAGLYCTAFGYRPHPFDTIHSVVFPVHYPDRHASLYS
jgi:hypothetical protein